MKSSLIPGLLGASIALFSSPAFAQDAPAAKQQQRVVVKKQQSKADSELLKKAAELSAKASKLAAKGDTAAAAKYAAEASALLKKAQKSERTAARDVARSAERATRDNQRERETRVRVERQSAEREARSNDQERRQLRIRATEAPEKEVRIRLKNDAEAVDQWVEIGEAPSVQVHEHAKHAYEEALKHQQQANELHEHMIQLQLEHGDLAEHQVLVEKLHQQYADAADHYVNIAPTIQHLENGQLQIELKAELESLADLGHLVELENLQVDLADLEAALEIHQLETGDLTGRLNSIQIEDLAQLGDALEGVDLEAMGIDLAGIDGANLQAYAFAMPHDGTHEGAWVAAPHAEHGALLHRYIARTQGACDCDCEGECEECEDCCEEGGAEAQAMAWLSAAGIQGGEFPGEYFQLGSGSELEKDVQIFMMPEGKEGMNWTSKGDASFGWTTDPGQNQVFTWKSDGENPFFHKQGAEVHGEHDVRILRSGEGGEIIIHGGSGEQNIYIQGRVIMGGECEMHEMEVHGQHGHDHGAHDHDVQQRIRLHGMAPAAPSAPAAPMAPRAPRAMLRLPNPPAAPRVLFEGREAPHGDLLPVIRGRMITDTGEVIEFTEEEGAPELETMLFVPRDAAAPAPAKAKEMEADKLIREMRAEMEALRQELSDLRRQMKDDPLVRAQHEARKEDFRVWRETVAATPVVDRKRAGLGSR